VRKRISDEPFSLPGNAGNVKVTISIGVAETDPFDKDYSNKVFDRADAALFRAKQTGRDKVVADA
jgi:diguanylate cyclase (GGDEF)-like protein